MFDAIIGFSLRNRALILIAALGLLLGGFYTALRLPIDVFPDLNAPTVTLLTEAHGMAPEQVEALVTFPLEKAVHGATGVRRVRSISAPGISIVHVEFDWEMDIYAARQIVSEKLQAALSSLPQDIPKPIMAPMASIMGEIMLIGLYAEKTDEEDRVSPMELRTIADWTMRRRLLAVPGVAQVVQIGGLLKEYQINILPDRLAALDLTLGQAYHAARDASKSV